MNLPYGRMLTPLDAERRLGIPRNRIAKWHSRRERTGLRPMGLDLKGDPLFWEADIIALSRRLPIWGDEGERLHTMDDLT